MWKLNCAIGFLTLVCAFQSTEGTACYQCDSWQHSECNEDNTYIDEKYLFPCSARNQITPTTCLKEVTTFLPGQIPAQLDRQNRYGRPHVMRRCGISLTGSSTYRQGDYYEGCTEEGGEVIVNGVQGERKTCTCLTDGCNSALPSGMINSVTVFGAVLSAFVFSRLF